MGSVLKWQNSVDIVLNYWLKTKAGSLKVPTELKKLIELFTTVAFDSKILSAKETSDLCAVVADKYPVDLLKCKLLFRATDDGFGAAKFHQLCDGKGATLTVVHTEFGHVIGGFTHVPWTSGWYFKCDTDAWLFVARVNEVKQKQLSGIRLPVILSANTSDEKHVFHFERNGPTFGDGYALRISDDCDINFKSHCQSSKSFSAVCDGVTLTPDAITGGPPVDMWTNPSFRVVDYEVFACN